jgi:hypothetical protein
VLSIDDAFAGGVCRCQHCGTIQTVPKQLKQSQRAAAPVPNASKTLYHNQARGDSQAGAPGTGLDELANIVASSGLSSPALRKTASKPDAVAAPPAVEHRRKNSMLIAIAGGAVVVIIAVVMWVVSHNAAVSPDTDGGTLETLPDTVAPAVSPAVHKPPAVSGPSFAGMALNDPTVIYVIDRGGSTQESFGDLMNAVYRSIASLGTDRQYQIIFWNNNDNREADVLYPPTGLASAGPTAAEAAKLATQNVVPFGQSTPVSALQKAEAQNPAAIVLATAKSWDLDEQFQKDVLGAHKNHSTRIDTLVIGPDDNDVMKAIAKATGGTYQKLTSGELAALGS